MTKVFSIEVIRIFHSDTMVVDYITRTQLNLSTRSLICLGGF